MKRTLIGGMALILAITASGTAALANHHRGFKTEQPAMLTVKLQRPHVKPDLCIGCGICQNECPVTDSPAVYVTSVGESRSIDRRLLLAPRQHAAAASELIQIQPLRRS